MVSDAFSGIQAMVDAYVQKIKTQYPACSIGVAIGAVTPKTPDGGIIYSSEPMISRSGGSMTPDAATPFEVGSVSKVFTTGIYAMRQPTVNFDGTLGQLLGPNMAMSQAVHDIPVQCLAAYSSGLPQDNGHCALHPSTGYPDGLTDSLERLFDFLKDYSTFPYNPGQLYSYSNLAVALLSMAALKLDSTDTENFGKAYNAALIEYCQTFGVDPAGRSATTLVYNQMEVGTLPVGYDHSFNEKVAPPCNVAGYGAGGVVSCAADMLKFLLYNMSPECVQYLQEYRWQHTAYCKIGMGPATGYGWFLTPRQMKNQSVALISKDGSVAGFTAWIAFEQRLSRTRASPRGIFVLTNGPDAVSLGLRAFSYLIPPEGSGDDTPWELPELSGDARVY